MNAVVFGEPTVGGPYLNSEGYLIVVLSYGEGWFRRQPYHKYLWEQEHGPLPEGYVLHHKDGDKLNNNLGNLAPMNRARHLISHNTTGVATVSFFCPVCGRQTVKLRNNIRTGAKRNARGPFCSRGCAITARNKKLGIGTVREFCEGRGIQ